MNEPSPRERPETENIAADVGAHASGAGTLVFGRAGVEHRIALALATVALALAYGPTMRTLWGLWRHNENYSHGFLVPLVSLWLIWRDRDRLRELVARGSWIGAAFLVPAAVLQVMGLRGDVATVQGVSLILAIAGIVGQIYGGRTLRRAAFPIAFLVFMIPVLPWFMNALSFRLKLVAAEGAVRIASALGVLVQRDGVNLVFPEGTLAVENACSGLRSLVALMALGALFAYLSRGRPASRIGLFVLALPIAVAANIVRIGSVCVYAGITGVGPSVRAFHDAGGYAIFGIAFLMLALCRRILRC